MRFPPHYQPFVHRDSNTIMEKQNIYNNELYPNETIRAITEFLFIETPLNEIGISYIFFELKHSCIIGPARTPQLRMNTRN